MKTSNRILLIFFINIFLIPLCLFIGFSAQIRNGNYKLVKNQYHSDGFRSGTLKPAHTISLMPSERELICNVEYGDSLYFDYDCPLSDDSLHIYSKGDTVYINYVGKIPEHILRSGQQPPLLINLRIPELTNLLVENGRINILSIDTTHTPSLTADVSGGGVLNIGGPAINTGQIHQGEKRNSLPVSIDQLNFHSINGSLELGEKANLRSLQLQVLGKSALYFDKGTQVKEISGSVSDSTNFSGNWDLIKKLNQ